MFSVAILVSLICYVDSWPRFRGPQSDGIAEKTSFPSEWSDTKNVVWKTKIQGLGWSSPVVVDGRVFLTTAVQEGESLSLRALSLDSKSGRILWDREIRKLDSVPGIHSKNSHASPTPIVHDGWVYVHFGTQGTAKLNANSGDIAWTCVDLVYPPVHGCGGSPALYDGRLAIICDGGKDPYVASVDAETGKVVWKTPRAVKGKISHSFGTPVVVQADGKNQILAPGPDHLAAYDGANGRELWRVVAPGWSVVPQPAIGHGMIFYNHDYDNPELMAVRLGGQGDVTDTHVVWRIKKGAPSTPSPLLIEDRLYFVSDKGIASCVDAKTGKQHWLERLPGDYSASPIFVNGRVLFMNESGVATWVAEGVTFSVLGTNEVSGRTFATPAFVEGAMYLRTDEHLFKYAE